MRLHWICDQEITKMTKISKNLIETRKPLHHNFSFLANWYYYVTVEVTRTSLFRSSFIATHCLVFTHKKAIGNITHKQTSEIRNVIRTVIN